MKYSISLPREFTISFLAIVYILGFLITPYWILYNSTSNIIFHLALTIITGWIWAFLSAGSLRVEFRSIDIWSFAITLLGVVTLNSYTLTSVIPYKGDEAFHIERTLEVAGRIHALEILIITSLFFILMMYAIKKQRWIILFLFLLLIAGIIYYYVNTNPFTDMLQYPLFYLRYPFINYWFFALIPKIVSLFGSPYHEILYRVIPVFFVSGVMWIWQKRILGSSFKKYIIWGLAIATLPLVFYYSSILYLEPPAVLLMMIVCFDINRLVQQNSKNILQLPSWYALILIGFIKETTISFLLCFITLRIIIQLWTWLKRETNEKARTSFKNLCLEELKVIFSVLIPIFIYLYFRTTLTSTRSFNFQTVNLIDLKVYYYIGISMIEQFGAFIVFFLSGCILLIKRKEYLSVFCYIFLVVAVSLFHTIDKKEFVGYSRFNLFILPPILALSIKFINWATNQSPYWERILIFFALITNLLLSPIYLDGTKTPYWGNHLIDTSEHYYPYQDALVWIKTNYPEKRVLFTGLDLYYPFQFYWNKLSWQPKRDGLSSENINGEIIELSKILEEAQSKNFDVVVYRVKDESIELPSDTESFRIRFIKNSAHSLIIFYRP